MITYIITHINTNATIIKPILLCPYLRNLSSMLVVLLVFGVVDTFPVVPVELLIF